MNLKTATAVSVALAIGGVLGFFYGRSYELQKQQEAWRAAIAGNEARFHQELNRQTGELVRRPPDLQIKGPGFNLLGDSAARKPKQP